MNRLFYPLLEPAIARSLREIEANPYRTSLNLVELGLKISSDPERRRTLTALRESLKNQDCAYHQLLPRLARTVRHDTVKAIGRNLVRNCMDEGRSQRKKLAQAWNHPVPAGVVFDLRGIPRGTPVLAQIDQWIRQGKPLGIFSYALALDMDSPPPRQLSQLCTRHQSCIFSMIFPPDLLSDADLEPIASCTNLLCTLLLNPANVNPAKNAMGKLVRHQALVGGCFSGTPADSPHSLMQAALGLDLAFLLLLQESDPILPDTEQAVRLAREQGQYPFIPLLASFHNQNDFWMRLHWQDSTFCTGSGSHTCTNNTLEQIIRQQ